MDDFWGLYDTCLNATGTNTRERAITAAKEAFLRSCVDNPGYNDAAKRNSVAQAFLFDRNDVEYKMNVVAMPGDELYVGDIIEAYGEYWICTRTRVFNEIHTTGLLWLCNHEFVFQNFSSDVIHRWGVLDSGVYSTTIAGDDVIQSADKQYKIYLPYDDATKKIYIDKRIATDVIYNSKGEEILDVYNITGVDAVSSSYGKGGHLFVLNARSGEYNHTTDNVELMLCDYIPPEDEVEEPKEAPKCQIKGRDFIRLGSYRNYEAEFISSDGTTADGIAAAWEVSPSYDGVTVSATEAGKLRVAVADREELIGAKLVVSVQDEAGIFAKAILEVEVKG